MNKDIIKQSDLFESQSSCGQVKPIVSVPMCLPKCKVHGQMMLRPLKHQTYEQKWCGVWYDCPECANSTLFPSPELLEFTRSN